MARFPEAHVEIFALARKVLEGMRRAGPEFASVPISVRELQRKVDRAAAAEKAVVDAVALLKARYARRNDDLAEMLEGVKGVLSLAEVIYRRTPERLAVFGWGKRRGRRRLKAPGEVRDLTLSARGDAWLRLTWNAPLRAGKVKAYRIQRRRLGDEWEEAGVATNRETLLIDQPRGVQLEYRISAINKAGDGAPSAVVTAVF